MNVYETVTNAIISALESVKEGDFKLPWHSSGLGTFPVNAVSKKPLNFPRFG